MEMELNEAFFKIITIEEDAILKTRENTLLEFPIINGCVKTFSKNTSKSSSNIIEITTSKSDLNVRDIVKTSGKLEGIKELIKLDLLNNNGANIIKQKHATFWLRDVKESRDEIILTFELVKRYS